jgi:hypothetical protein
MVSKAGAERPVGDAVFLIAFELFLPLRSETSVSVFLPEAERARKRRDHGLITGDGTCYEWQYCGSAAPIMSRHPLDRSLPKI